MSTTPLQQARAGAAAQDDMGGFKTAAAMLFPGWEPKRSCRAPNREDRSPSFSVYRNQAGEWRFKDQATGEQGGLVGFAMLAGMNEKAASRWLMDKAGIRAGQPISFTPKPRAQSKPQTPAKLPPMPVEAMSKWSEGVDLQANPAAVDRLAEWRGWPVEFARYMAESACVSMPSYHGQRTTAFLVEVPESYRGRNALGGQITQRRLPLPGEPA